MRVLKWMIDRIEGKAKARSDVRRGPTICRDQLDGLDFSAEQFAAVTSIDKAAWQKELKLHDELFEQLAYHLPQALLDTKAFVLPFLMDQ
jgi:phosphoenolpyruvate carboxykinase (GTP)